jgi:hypothetical protein
MVVIAALLEVLSKLSVPEKARGVPARAFSHVSFLLCVSPSDTGA